jgi:hypothetical protein
MSTLVEVPKVVPGGAALVPPFRSSPAFFDEPFMNTPFRFLANTFAPYETGRELRVGLLCSVDVCFYVCPAFDLRTSNSSAYRLSADYLFLFSHLSCSISV